MATVLDVARYDSSCLISKARTFIEKYEKEYKNAYSDYQDQQGHDAFRGRGDIGLFGKTFKDIPKTSKNLIFFNKCLKIVNF